ncbi:hypothetical protein DFH28DRAFT_965265 [Melampsora americana]|nr:hypothetical protein DFH28DRAFT_965265 [Melampsora americana]
MSDFKKQQASSPDLSIQTDPNITSLPQSPDHRNLFVYGTLINKSILERVLGRSSSDLRCEKGLISDHSRLQLRHADYPALVPSHVAQNVFQDQLSIEESQVNGLLIIGLNMDDFCKLDQFEGDEYIIKKILVKVNSSPQPIQANVYIYSEKFYFNLLPKIWSYDHFLIHHFQNWFNDPNQFLEIQSQSQTELNH